MIVIIAPYSPAERNEPAHLGAARKIEVVINILSCLGYPIVMVNTAHGAEGVSTVVLEKKRIAGVELVEIFPPTYFNRRIGKLLNLLSAKTIADVVMGLGEPRLVWLYNGYAMESRLGVLLHQRTGCRVVQEMEDWHFSRSRGINPKPFIDWWFWRAAARNAAHIFAVNQSLAERARRLNSRVSLFPGVVAAGVSEMRVRRQPFSSEDNEMTIGYFGGLSEEKGADRVLALCELLPKRCRAIVTGSGPLEDSFRRAAAAGNGRLEFHGRVSDEILNGLISRCDVLLNPHSPITDMDNGVFPFKVIESIASGRLLISTPLPGAGLEDALQGVCFVGHGDAQFLQAVVGAREWYQANKSQVEAGSDAALQRFGMAAILRVVNEVMSDPGA